MRKTEAGRSLMAVKIALLAIIGFAGGIIVGAGFVAFLTVLGIIPRLVQLTKTQVFIRAYEWGVVGGAVVGGWLGLRDIEFNVSNFWLIPIGMACGIFVGMLAAALTEVLNVLPILAKRIGIDEQKIIILLMALVLGKIFGSLFHWTYFVIQ
jgi:stage V sporulation protein AB